MPYTTGDENLYDVGINGTGYLVDFETLGNEAYVVDAPDLTFERSDQDDQITENKLDRADWRSIRSAHHGAGQQRFDVPNLSDEFKFLESKGVDVTTAGEVSLLPATSRLLSLSNGGDAPQVSAAGESFLAVAAGTPNLKILYGDDDTSPQTVSTDANTETYDLAADGRYLYIANGTHGIHRMDQPASTQRDAMDATTGWAFTAGADGGDTEIAAITADKQEGTASLAFDSFGLASSGVWKKALSGAPVDLSTMNAVRLWYKGRAATIRFYDGAGYYEGTLSDTSGAWSRVTIAKTAFTSSGSPNWNSIDEIGVTPLATAADATLAGGTLATASSASVVQTRLVVFWFPASQPTITAPANYTLIGRTDYRSGEGSIVSYYTSTPSSSSATWTFSASVAHAVYRMGTASSPAFFDTPSFAENETNASAASFSTGALTVTKRSLILGFVTADAGAYTLAMTGGTGTTTAGRLSNDVGTGSKHVYPCAIIVDANTTPTFTASGSVAFNGAHAILLPVADFTPFRAQVDDVTTVTAATATHWSDHDTRVLGTARNAVYGAGISSGTIWRFFEAGATTTSVNLLTLADGWTVTDIAGFGKFVYFSAYAGSIGRVYCYDGTNTFVAWESPIGTQPLSLTAYLGQGLLIGCRLSVTGSTKGHGVVYRASASSTGVLSAVRVTKFGDHNADYGVYTGFALGDEAYFGRTNQDSSSTGIFVFMPRVDPESGQQRADYASHLYADTQGLIRSSGVAFGKKYFTVDGSGVWLEQDTFVDSGTITSSDIDWNIDKPKLVLQGEVGCEPLSDDETVALAYSTDDGTTYTTLATASGAATRIATGNIRSAIRSLRLKATLTANTDNDVSPVMKKMGVSAIYGVKPKYTHKLVLKTHDKLRLRNGVPHPDSGRPGLALRQFAALKTLRDDQTVVTFNPPGYGYETSSTVSVRLGGLRYIESRDQDLRTGRIVVELVEVPS